ncbi:MAG: SDR family oxidoreductase [Sciscionella sp.]
MRTQAELRARIVERTSTGRLAEPTDVAALALLLASDMCRHLNGTTISVDGAYLRV